MAMPTGGETIATTPNPTIIYVGCNNEERVGELLALLGFLTVGTILHGATWVPMQHKYNRFFTGAVTVREQYIPMSDRAILEKAMDELDTVVVSWERAPFMGTLRYMGNGDNRPAKYRTLNTYARFRTASDGSLGLLRAISQLTPSRTDRKILMGLTCSDGSRLTTQKEDK